MLTLLFACSGATSIPNDTAASGGTGLPADSGLPADTNDTEDSGPDDTGHPDKPECGELPADDVGYAALFDPSVLHMLALTVADSQAADLSAEPSKWAEAQLTLDGAVLTSIGVKWRGDSAQMRWDGKPSWTLGFRDQYACDTVAGVDRLELDAMMDDPAQGRVVLESLVLSGLGRVAPHAVYATLTVNGEAFGLYALTETVDVNFVTHRYGAAAATLWTANNGADFTTTGLTFWDDPSGVADPTVLQAVADVVAGSESTFYADLGAVLDPADLTTHWAALAAVGDMGAFPFETDDVDLLLPTGDALQFVADKPGSGWNVSFDWAHVDTALGVRCVYDVPCTAAMKAALSSAATQLAALDTESTVTAAFALTNDALAEDSRRGTKLSVVHDARDALAETISGWPSVIEP